MATNNDIFNLMNEIKTTVLSEKSSEVQKQIGASHRGAAASDSLYSNLSSRERKSLEKNYSKTMPDNTKEHQKSLRLLQQILAIQENLNLTEEEAVKKRSEMVSLAEKEIKISERNIKGNSKQIKSERARIDLVKRRLKEEKKYLTEIEKEIKYSKELSKYQKGADVAFGRTSKSEVLLGRGSIGGKLDILMRSLVAKSLGANIYNRLSESMSKRASDEKGKTGKLGSAAIIGSTAAATALVQGAKLASKTLVQGAKMANKSFSGGIEGAMNSLVDGVGELIDAIPFVGDSMSEAFRGVGGLLIQEAMFLMRRGEVMARRGLYEQAMTGRKVYGKEGAIAGYGALADPNLTTEWANALAGTGIGTNVLTDKILYGREKITSADELTSNQQADILEKSNSWYKFWQPSIPAARIEGIRQGKMGLSPFMKKRIEKNMPEDLWKDTSRKETTLEKFYRYGASMGLGAGEAGTTLSNLLITTGTLDSNKNPIEALNSMEKLYGQIQESAKETGISAAVFRDATIQTAVAARALNVDFDSVNNAMYMVAKTSKSLKGFGIDLRTSAPGIMQDLVARKNMSFVQHAFLGSQLQGMQGYGAIQQAYASRYGRKIGTGNLFAKGGGAAKGLSANMLDKTLSKDALEVMWSTLYQNTTGAENDQQRLEMMKRMGKTMFGLGEEATTALVMSKKEDIGKLAVSPEWKTATETAEHIARSTNTIAAKQLAIQEKILTMTKLIATMDIENIGDATDIIKNIYKEAFNVLRSPTKGTGGTVLPNSSYIVGDKGPEILQMGSAGGQIIPNASSYSSGKTIINNITINGSILNNSIAEQLAKEISSRL